MANTLARILSQLRIPIPIALGGTGKTTEFRKRHIDGLYMKYNSANSLTVTEGSAYIPGTGSILELTAPVILSGLTLTANTWYHLYLYSNAGTPTLELVTTAPDTPYFSTARGKTGDASRRYVGSVLSAAANTLHKFSHYDGEVQYHVYPEGAPFLLVLAAVITPTTINYSALVPVTATHSVNMVLNSASDTTARFANPDFTNPLSNVLYDYFCARSASSIMVMGLSAAKTLQWRHDGAANGNLLLGCIGYRFER